MMIILCNIIKIKTKEIMCNQHEVTQYIIYKAQAIKCWLALGLILSVRVKGPVRMKYEKRQKEIRKDTSLAKFIATE